MADGARGREHWPRPLGEAIGRVRDRLEPPTLLARVQARWEAAVGEVVAAQATPVSERRGVIVVACRSATWSSELSLLSQTLLEELNESLGEGARASGLKFTVDPS